MFALNNLASKICFIYCIILCINSVRSVKKPNIVLVITDDQDSIIGGLIPMKSTKRLVAKQGVTFVNSFTAAPICCPSRSSLLTGMYPHNHRTINNTLSGGCSSSDWQKYYETRTFASVLQREAKYATFYGGKYLNQYGHKAAEGPKHVPPGWSSWRGLIGNSKYYNFSLSIDGILKSYFNGEYLTDVVKDEALKFIDDQSKKGFSNPMLLVMAPPSPHAPFIPAPRHSDAFNGTKALKPPNFNIPAGIDKHWLMRMSPSPLPNSTLEKLDHVYKSRLQTLLSVDEMVEAIYDKMEAYELINNTYFIFTSDNGYHIGQFSQAIDKRQPYETDIRVPLFIKGPGIESNTIKYYPAINIDLAPTILKMAGITPLKSMDGIPLPIFSENEAQRLESFIQTNEVSLSETYDRQILVEYHGEKSTEPSTQCSSNYDLNVSYCNPEFFCKCEDSINNTYNCVRHLHPVIDFIYCAFNDAEGFEEMYDIMKDPFQLHNIVSEVMPAIKFKYQNTLRHLLRCSGKNCNDYKKTRY